MSLGTSHTATFEIAGAAGRADPSVFEKSQLRQTQTGAMKGEDR